MIDLTASMARTHSPCAHTLNTTSKSKSNGASHFIIIVVGMESLGDGWVEDEAWGVDCGCSTQPRLSILAGLV